LRDWAENEGLKIEAMSVGGLPSEFDEQPNAQIVILSIGGQSITGPEIGAALHTLVPIISEAPLVVLSDRDESTEVIEAFRIGASGFLPMSLNPSVALLALTFILHGGTFFPASALLRVPETPGGEGSDQSLVRHARILKLQRSGNGLTDRQRDVANLLRQGLANKIIARQLAMTEATVKVHVRHIMHKLGASNRTQAALFASQIKDMPPKCVDVDEEVDRSSGRKSATAFELSNPARSETVRDAAYAGCKKAT
jgi:DNA-binding NarL/FixJ family response regulator